VFVERHVRNQHALAQFAFWVALATVLVIAIVPAPAHSTASAASGATASLPVQSLVVAVDEGLTVTRDIYRATPRPLAPVAGVPDAGSAKAIAWELLQARGWGTDQYDCLVSLWTRESHWNTFAENKSSGAYGIPQALPGSKMAAFGDDWRTNPETQIQWGLAYISGRYSTPCGAWSAFQSKGWY
jgi:hypothetical protein